jgi:predicted phosphodiesterase
MEKYNRLDNETDEELIYRVCKDKDIIGSWNDVADILNDLLGTEYTESKFRKSYQAFNKMLEANQNKILDDDNYVKEIRLEKQELQKEKQKLSDERVEFNKQVREQARKESFEDMIKRIVCENVKPLDWNDSCGFSNIGDNDLLIPISDIHTGIEVNQFCNTFNQDVLKERLEEYTRKIIEIKNIHNSENAYIVIGEVVSGIIHNNLRLQNNMDLMESFKYIMELLSCMLSNLSSAFNEINVYTTLGNHSRISPKKEDSLQGENIDVLVPFYLKAKLQNIVNIKIYENEICQDIAMFNIRGNNVFSAHGQNDNVSNVVQNWTMMFGIKPDLVLLGHRHFNEVTTVYDTKVIQTGSILGTDDFAMSIRKTNKAEQNVAVIDKNGLVCTYDVRLN